MGCDIHAVWQNVLTGTRHDGSTYAFWVTLPNGDWDQQRHYFLFAWLAGVRNGFGFAGVPAHDPVVPIAQPRGVPADSRCHVDDLGDHSYSWLTADEILAAQRPETGVMRAGVVERKFIETWDRKSQPSEFCCGISGKGISVAASISTMLPGDTHVCIEWPMPSSELDYFVDEVRRMRGKHGPTLRLVFGFDS